MVIKAFNVNENVYGRFLQFCKDNRIGMSSQIEMFMRPRIEDKEEIKEEYLQKLEEIRRGKFIKVDDFAKRYSL